MSWKKKRIKEKKKKEIAGCLRWVKFLDKMKGMEAGIFQNNKYIKKNARHFMHRWALKPLDRITTMQWSLERRKNTANSLVKWPALIKKKDKQKAQEISTSKQRKKLSNIIGQCLANNNNNNINTSLQRKKKLIFFNHFSYLQKIFFLLTEF